mgnify:CR=1 FL=1
MVLNLFAGEVGKFGRKDGTTTFEYANTALAAGALTAASRGNMNVLLCQSGEQAVACRNTHLFVVIDGNGYIAFGDEFCTQKEEQSHQEENNYQENDKRGYDCICHCSLFFIIEVSI